jgi:hypothetical protein
MGDFLKIKFVFFLLFISQVTFSQERRIKVFQKKTIIGENAKLTDNNLHLLTFPIGNRIYNILINQNSVWQTDMVFCDEWEELSGNTLIVVQQLEEESIRQIKKQPKPILLSNFTINEFKSLNNKNRECYSISWSMNTIYAGDSSIQTSKKIETSNACDNGTCSVVITIEKKKGKVYLVLGVK